MDFFSGWVVFLFKVRWSGGRGSTETNTTSSSSLSTQLKCLNSIFFTKWSLCDELGQIQWLKVPHEFSKGKDTGKTKKSCSYQTWVNFASICLQISSMILLELLWIWKRTLQVVNVWWPPVAFQAPIPKGLRHLHHLHHQPPPPGEPSMEANDWCVEASVQGGLAFWGYRGGSLKDSQGFQATAASKPLTWLARNTDWFLEILLKYCNPYMIGWDNPLYTANHQGVGQCSRIILPCI